MSRYIKKISQDTRSFICGHCGSVVSPADSGGEQRNHCPRCLWSRHVDLRIGDRRSGCRGMMEPVGIWIRKSGEWAVIHRCESCGFLRANRIAADDDEFRLFTLAAKPLASLPFPASVIDGFEPAPAGAERTGITAIQEAESEDERYD